MSARACVDCGEFETNYLLLRGEVICDGCVGLMRDAFLGLRAMELAQKKEERDHAEALPDGLVKERRGEVIRVDFLRVNQIANEIINTETRRTERNS